MLSLSGGFCSNTEKKAPAETASLIRHDILKHNGETRDMGVNSQPTSTCEQPQT